ncbi:accessory gene regulator ArgB-like protein [Alkaliphilus serpentinus]|uniref:Accessory gene regulator B family protein n=1 Tax=Alkaliphilus serpentinus TaxID=1482731 RepID=A0A833HPE1_9FIRM|nr:accessory gene regulator B family protein [Alkaliphilus serpentinus]KAB3530566.1 accessory gene regulator B family protein [Alkaliphilus serpentinus]
MLYNFAYNLAVKLEKNSLIKYDDIDYCRYGIEMFVITVFKTTILLALAAAAGFTKELIVYMIAFSTLRIQAGGIHADSIILCLSVTALTAYTAIKLSSIIPIEISLLFVMVCLMISGIFIYLYSPKDTPNKPLDNEERVVYRRRSLITYIIGCGIILVFSFLRRDLLYYTNIASLGFLIEAVTLTPMVSGIIKTR